MTDLNANELISTEKRPILVDFWTSRCETCRANAAIADGLRLEYQGALVLAKVNVEACPYTVAALQVSLVPSMMLLKDGKKVGEYLGLGDAGAVRAALGGLGVFPASPATCATQKETSC